MNRKIWKALGIAVCMLALAAPRAMAETHRVGSEKQFKDAVEAINKPGDAKKRDHFDAGYHLGWRSYPIYIIYIEPRRDDHQGRR